MNHMTETKIPVGKKNPMPLSDEQKGKVLDYLYEETIVRFKDFFNIQDDKYLIDELVESKTDRLKALLICEEI